MIGSRPEASTLRRRVFANPLYGLTLAGRAPASPRGTPPDPWPGDAEAGATVLDGEFLLAGAWHRLGRNPWASPPAGEAARAELHGFDWLRDLRAVATDAARRRALGLLGSWLDTCDRWHPVAWRPDVLGTRTANWLVVLEPWARDGTRTWPGA